MGQGTKLKEGRGIGLRMGGAGGAGDPIQKEEGRKRKKKGGGIGPGFGR